MKIIFKKPLWLTVLTTLCLIVVTLLAAGGCDNAEILPKHYTVIFVGEGVVIEQQSITHGNYAIAPENPEREGYGFGGWFTDKGTFANEWDFKTDIVMQDTTLYAKWEESALQGTQWKLIGIVDVQIGDTIELEPKDCEGCYTITFDTDSTFSGGLVCNTMFGKHKIDYKTYDLHFSDVVSTEVGCIWNGKESLYSQILYKIQSFIINDTTYPRMLHLYYNGGKNYLKYIEIGD